MMILIVISILLFFLAVVAINYIVVPNIVKKEGGLVRAKVDELAAQLSEQLSRVEARQQGVTTSAAGGSFATDPPWSITLGRYRYADLGRLTNDLRPQEAASWQEGGLAQAFTPWLIPVVPENIAGFFNSVVKEMGERIGGRVWIVETSGAVIGEATESDEQPKLQSLNDFSLPMATPLRRLLAQGGDDVRQTHFLTASGEHTLIVQPVSTTSWLLAMDIPTRQLGQLNVQALKGSYPQSLLLMVASLTLTRHFTHRLSSLMLAISTFSPDSDVDFHGRTKSVQGQLAGQFQQFMDASCAIARGNQALMDLRLMAKQPDEDRVALLADSAALVVQKMRGIHQAAVQLAASCGAIMQLAGWVEKLALDSPVSAAGERQAQRLSVAHAAHELAQQSCRAIQDIRLVIASVLPGKETELQQLEQADETMQALRSSMTSVAALIGDLSGGDKDEAELEEASVLPQLARHSEVLIAETYRAIRELKAVSHALRS